MNMCLKRELKNIIPEYRDSPKCSDADDFCDAVCEHSDLSHLV